MTTATRSIYSLRRYRYAVKRSARLHGHAATKTRGKLYDTIVASRGLTVRNVLFWMFR